MPQTIPIQAVPSQTLNVVLSDQNCQIDIYQTISGLFMDVSVNNSLVIGGVICQNLNRIVRDLYLGFIGDFMFQDNMGTSDPVFTGLNSQYTLLYLLPADLPLGQG